MSGTRPGPNLSRRSAVRLMIGATGLAAGFSHLPIDVEMATSLMPRCVPAPEQTSEDISRRPWWGQELIRGHISWIHPVWTRPERDFDARKWLDQFERAGLKSFVFYSKFHDGICNWPSKLQELKPARDFVGEITVEAHRRKVRVIIYYSGFLDNYAADRHPDWRCVRRSGSAAGKIAPGYDRWFKYARCCPNSPYRDYALGQIEELLAKYDVDGFWIDAMFFPGPDPLDPEQRHLGCFCQYCREKYMLQTGASLFDIDGTPEQGKWEADCVLEFFSTAKQIVRKKGSDKSITYNACGELGPPYYWPRIQQLGDYLSMEAFQFAQIEISRMCRLMRSYGKPFEAITEASGQPLAYAPRNPDLLLLEGAASAAHGGTYLVALDPTASGRIFDDQIDQVASVSAYLRERQSWFANTSPVYDGAVFHPSYLSSEAGDSKAPLLSSISRGWADLLGQRNIPYAYLYPDADLSPYRLIVLDGSFPVSDELVERLMMYVKRGGRVLAELKPNQLDSPAGDRLLSDVFGIHLQGTTGFEAVYVGRLDPSIATGMTEMPLLVEGPSYRVQPNTAQTIAYYLYPLAPWGVDRMVFSFHNPPSDRVSSDPAITLNSYGDGLAMFVACSLGTTEIRRHQNMISDPQLGAPDVLPQVHAWALQFGENLALRLIDEPLLRSEVPAGVEIVVNKQEGRHIVHLLNYLSSPMLFTDDHPGRLELADLPLAINEKRIGHVRRATTFDGTVVPLEREGKWLRVIVPRLKIHHMIAFEKE